MCKLVSSIIAVFAFNAYGSSSIPQSLYYKGKVISPLCISERTSHIIDLDNCPNSYDGMTNDSFEKNGEITVKGSTATVTYYTGSGEDKHFSTKLFHFSGAMFEMKYLGKFNSDDLITLRLTWYNGRGYDVYNSVLLSYKRDGNKLYVEKSLPWNEDFGLLNTEESEIINGKLNLRFLISNNRMWQIMRNVALKADPIRYKSITDWNLYYASYWTDYCGEAVYVLDKLDTSIADSTKFIINSTPAKLQFQARIGSVTHEQELAEYKNYKFIYNNQEVASAFPYYQTFYSFYSQGKENLTTTQDMLDFVDELMAKGK